MNNDDELLTKHDDGVKLFMGTVERLIKGIDNLRRRNRPLLGGHRYLTDEELSERLKINRRTLQDYRNQERIPYIKLGGKILYREQDIEELLQSNYHPRLKER